MTLSVRSNARLPARTSCSVASETSILWIVLALAGTAHLWEPDRALYRALAYGRESMSVDTIEQRVLFVERRGKQALLQKILGAVGVERALVFTKTKRPDRAYHQVASYYRLYSEVLRELGRDDEAAQARTAAEAARKKADPTGRR